MNKIIIYILFFFFSFTLCGEDLIDTIEFSRENWVIGIEEFTGDLSPANNYLKKSLPDLIKKDLLNLDLHVISEKEKLYYQDQIFTDIRKNLILQLAKKFETKDDILFSDDMGGNEYFIANKEIEELKSKINELGQLDSSQIKTAELLMVEWAGDEDNKFYTPDEYIPEVRVELDDLDFLISGNIVEIEEYIFLEIYGFDRSTSKEFLIYSNTGLPDEVELMTSDVIDKFRSIILGRSWAVLKVVTDQPDSMIYADGVLIGVGTAEEIVIDPSKVHIEAIGEGSSYWSGDFELTALEINEISGVLSESNVEFLTLNTEPEGADVYIGARRAGVTPLKLPRYENKNIWVSIRTEGYYEKSFEISENSPDDLFFHLEVEQMSRTDIFQLRKEEFYRSLGWFSVSLAGPIITIGVTDNYLSKRDGSAILYNEYNTLILTEPTTYNVNQRDYYRESYNDMNRNYGISFGVFWGTIALNTGLLVDVFVKLSRYIKAAEAMAE